MKGGITSRIALLACSLLAVGGTTQAMILCELPAETKKVRVSVVVIIASEKSKKICPRLDCIAKEVQKRHPKFTGFRIKRTIRKTLKLKGPETFELVINQKAKITLLKEIEGNRVQLKVKPPTVGTIIYTTICGKYFPIITRHRPGKHELLILAICVHPCKKK